MALSTPTMPASSQGSNINLSLAYWQTTSGKLKSLNDQQSNTASAFAWDGSLFEAWSTDLARFDDIIEGCAKSGAVEISETDAQQLVELRSSMLEDSRQALQKTQGVIHAENWAAQTFTTGATYYYEFLAGAAGLTFFACAAVYLAGFAATAAEAAAITGEALSALTALRLALGTIAGTAFFTGAYSMVQNSLQQASAFIAGTQDSFDTNQLAEATNRGMAVGGGMGVATASAPGMAMSIEAQLAARYGKAFVESIVGKMITGSLTSWGAGAVFGFSSATFNGDSLEDVAISTVVNSALGGVMGTTLMTVGVSEQIYGAIKTTARVAPPVVPQEPVAGTGDGFYPPWLRSYLKLVPNFAGASTVGSAENPMSALARAMAEKGDLVASFDAIGGRDLVLLSPLETPTSTALSEHVAGLQTLGWRVAYNPEVFPKGAVDVENDVVFLSQKAVESGKPTLSLDAIPREQAPSAKPASGVLASAADLVEGAAERAAEVLVQSARALAEVFPPIDEATTPSSKWGIPDFFRQAIRINTTSREGAVDVTGKPMRPSTPSQWELAGKGASHLRQLGFKVSIDENGNVMGLLDSNLPVGDPAIETTPIYLMTAHMDTANQVSFEGVKPFVIENYQGGNILLADGTFIQAANTPSLKHCIGHRVIVTDGTTGLGADNKAGMAAVLEVARRLATDPTILHGKVIVALTTDEEIGELGIPLGNAEFGYATVGSTHDYERPNLVTADTFDAWNAPIVFSHEPLPSTTLIQDAQVVTVRITGVVTHPGMAYGKMIHAPEVAAELITGLRTTNLSTSPIKPYSITNDPDGQWLDLSLAFESGNASLGENLTAALDAIAARYPGVRITQTTAAEENVDVSRAPLVQAASRFIAAIPEPLRPQNARHFDPYNWPNGIETNLDGSVSIPTMLFRAFDVRTNLDSMARAHTDLAAVRAEFPGVRTTATAKSPYTNMRSVIDQDPNVERIVREAIVANGLTPIPDPARGGTTGSDAALSHGVKMPNFGAGGGNEHSTTEFWDVDQGIKTADIIVDVLKGWVAWARTQVSAVAEAPAPTATEPGTTEVGG